MKHFIRILLIIAGLAWGTYITALLLPKGIFDQNWLIYGWCLSVAGTLFLAFVGTVICIGRKNWNNAGLLSLVIVILLVLIAVLYAAAMMTGYA